MKAIVLITATLTLSCVHPATVMVDTDHLRFTASRDFQCPTFDVKITRVKDRQYSAEGCEKKATYTCENAERGWFESQETRCQKINE